MFYKLDSINPDREFYVDTKKVTCMVRDDEGARLWVCDERPIGVSDDDFDGILALKQTEA